MCRFSKPLLEVANVPTLDVDVNNQDITQAVKQKYPHMDTVELAKN
jgi:hypothetical protein